MGCFRFFTGMRIDGENAPIPVARMPMIELRYPAASPSNA
jgi:hypothetical protein